MLNENVLNIKESLIRKISNESRKYENVLNLTIGEPDLPTPIGITQACIEYMQKNKINYSPTGGIVELKEEIATYYNEKYGSIYNENNVLVCSGSTEALSSTLRTIIREGDEILIPLPAYPGYEPLVQMSLGKSIFIDTTKKEFKITIEDIEKNITKKTKAIILNYPNNPTGVCLNKLELKKIVEYCLKKGIYIISDEIYEALSFSENNSISSYFNSNKIILIGGFSKSHSMTGYRLGYLLGEKKLIEQIKKVSQFTITSPNIIAQWGGVKALKEYKNREEMAIEYNKRFEFLKEKLEKLKIKVIKSQGGIYLYFKNPLKNKKSYDFVLEFLQEEHVALVPGEAFKNEGYIRVSLVKSICELEIFVEKIKSFLKK